MEELNPNLPDRKADLLRKKVLNQLSKEESEELNQFIEKDHLQQLLLELTEKKHQEEKKRKKKKRVHLVKTGLAAILIVILIITAGWVIIYADKNKAILYQRNKILQQKDTPAYDIKPAEIKAVLTMADGKVVKLDSTSGESAEEIMKAAEDYATIKLDSGRKYKVRLPDQTKVWLNGSSRMSFPTLLNGCAYEVQLEGEAYFRIKPRKIPFKIEVGSIIVETEQTASVNIKAYPKEQDIKITLFKGTATLTNKNTLYTLHKGQQARISKDGSVRIVKRVL